MALQGLVKADQGKNVWVLFFLFSKGKRGGAWLVRLGRLLQAEKGLWGWWGGREAAGVPFPPSSSLRPQSA